MGTLTHARTNVRALAERCGESLIDSAMRHDGGACWLAPTIGHDGAVVERTGDPTWYDGSAGIGHACVTAGLELGHSELIELGRAAINHAIAHASRVVGAGLHDGLTGIAVAAIDAGNHLGDQAMCRSGVTALERALALDMSSADVINGFAGRLIGTAWCHSTGAIDASAAIRHDATRLIELAERNPWGWSWPNPSEPALCGLAHGAGGVIEALGVARSLLGDLEAAERAIDQGRRFEQSWFDPDTSGWPDLRDDGEAVRPGLWCHGSVGIGMARLSEYRRRPSPTAAAEGIAAAHHAAACAREFAGVPGGMGFTRCHGLAGVIELLVMIDHVLPGDHRELAGSLVDDFVTANGDDPALWAGGIQGRPGPGRMNGLAGAMLTLLQLDGSDLTMPVGC